MGFDSIVVLFQPGQDGDQDRDSQLPFFAVWRHKASTYVPGLCVVGGGGGDISRQ